MCVILFGAEKISERKMCQEQDGDYSCRFFLITVLQLFSFTVWRHYYDYKYLAIYDSDFIVSYGKNRFVMHIK